MLAPLSSGRQKRRLITAERTHSRAQQAWSRSRVEPHGGGRRQPRLLRRPKDAQGRGGGAAQAVSRWRARLEWRRGLLLDHSAVGDVRPRHGPRVRRTGGERGRAYRGRDRDRLQDVGLGSSKQVGRCAVFLPETAVC